MIAAFFHDAPLVQANDGHIYSVGFPYFVWERYLTVFDSIVVSTRLRADHSPESELIRKMKRSSGPGVRFQPITSYRRKLDLLFNRRGMKAEIRETLRQVDCAIVRLPSMIGQIACQEARQMGKPVLIEVVGCAWDSFWNFGGIAGKILAPFHYLKMRKTIRSSAHTIYITQHFLQSRYPAVSKTSVCPNVNINVVSEQVLKDRLMKIEQKSDKDRLVFGLVGSLDVAYKGHEAVIRALSLIKDQLPEFRIEFLGGGNPERWMKLADKYGVLSQVAFLGTLPSGDQVLRWMDQLDICLQPSLAEAQGRSIIEEMSRGCPVIASRVGGIVELLDDDWLIKSGDYRDLARKILAMAGNKQLMKRQAVNNYNEAKLYDRVEIEKKRTQFLTEFKHSVQGDLQSDAVRSYI